MTEANRRLAESGTPFQRALVRSAAQDAAPPDGKAKLVAGLVASGVAVGASTAGAAGVAKVAAAGGMSSFAKWTIILSAFSGLVAGGVVTVEMLGDRSTVQHPATSLVQGRTSPAQRASTGESERPVPTTSRNIAKPAQTPVPAVPVKPSPSSEKPAAAPPAAASATEDPATTLAEQVRILDNARAALRAGNADRALSLLASYRARFPKGELHPEARALENDARRVKNQSGSR